VRCTNGPEVTCTFDRAGTKSKIVWAENGKARFRTRGFSQVCTLDGACKPVTKRTIRVAGPVQLRK